MKNLPLAVLCFALTIMGASKAEGPDDDTTEAVFEFAFMVFEEFRITPEIGVVYEPILSERFGAAKRTESREEYDDPTYKVVREDIVYDGVEIVISRGVGDPPSGWTWLKQVRVSSPKYLLRHGLRVGDSVERFEEVLGSWRERSGPENSHVSFHAGGYGEPGGMTHGAHATVTLEVDGQDSVTAVDIRYWAD